MSRFRRSSPFRIPPDRELRDQKLTNGPKTCYAFKRTGRIAEHAWARLEEKRCQKLSMRRCAKQRDSIFCEKLRANLRVWVSSKRPNGITKSQYEQLLRSNPKAKNWDWRMMRRNAAVYVRGRVWHKDHKTIVLDAWHRVLMNTEHQAPGRGSVVFLD